MASSSSGNKPEEQQQPKPTYRAPRHMSLPMPAVEKLKEIQNWKEKYCLTYNEEKIRRVNEIQENMDINDLLSYVMYGDGEEVVWSDDVWNVQSIKEVPEYREAKRLKTAPMEDVAEPPNLVAKKPLDKAATEKPLDNGKI